MMGGGFDFNGRLWMDWDDLVHILLRAYIFNHQYTNVPVDSQSVTEAKVLTSEYAPKTTKQQDSEERPRRAGSHGLPPTRQTSISTKKTSEHGWAGGGLTRRETIVMVFGPLQEEDGS